MKANDLDFNQVAMFVAIAEARGIGAAATRLKLPKSSVSRNLTQLEKELGAELVVRHAPSRPFELTEAGRALYDSASTAIATLNGARDGIRRDASSPRGSLRVAAPPALAAWLVAPFIARFVRQYPEVDVELTATTRTNMSPARDGFDVILSIGKQKDSAAKARSLGTVDGGVFGSETYLRERGTPRRPEDLARHDCIRQGTLKEKTKWSLLGTGGLVSEVIVSGHIRVDDMFTATAAAVANGGLVVLPVHAGKDPLAKTLVCVLPDHVVRGETAYVLYPPSSHLPMRVKLFVDALVEIASATCTGHATTPATNGASTADLRNGSPLRKPAHL